MTLLYVLAALVAGTLLGYLIAISIKNRNSVDKHLYDDLNKNYQQLQLQQTQSVSKTTLEQLYVSKELHQHTLKQIQEQKFEKDELQRYLQAKDSELVQLHTACASLKKENENLQDKMSDFKEEVIRLQELSEEKFKNLATEILNHNSKEFALNNKSNMDILLNPLKQDITQFKKTIEETRKEDIQDITSLKKELEALQKMNQQLSGDAQRLSKALQSDVKVQGNWGEDRLKLILEAEGLEKYIDYSTQGAFKDTEENITRKPDLILNLPGGQHIIIDSKVSLNAYIQYFNAQDNNEKKSYLQQLAKNIIHHIDDLSAKNYQHLQGLNAPPFVFMFMHFESALSLALNENPDIFDRALKKNIVIITPTTLVAAMKMVKMIWQKENRVKNVEEIFKQCGALHDKFVSFLEDMSRLGDSLQSANNSYTKALNKLSEGARRGDTITGKIDNIKRLEAKTTKQIPQQFISDISLLEDDFTGSRDAEADVEEDA